MWQWSVQNKPGWEGGFEWWNNPKDTCEACNTHLTVERPFLTTPFAEYNVTEGFALMFFIMFVIVILYQYVRRFI
jgi:hypothetical protein